MIRDGCEQGVPLAQSVTDIWISLQHAHWTVDCTESSGPKDVGAFVARHLIVSQALYLEEHCQLIAQYFQER